MDETTTIILDEVEEPAFQPIIIKPVDKLSITKRRGKADKIEADFTGHYKYGWVPTDALLVDPEYQRKLIQRKVSKIAHNWDQNKVGTFVVNHRATGQYFVIDGQHRHAALQLIEHYPSHVYCQIFEGLTKEQEAQMFHDLDSERDNLTPGASFHASLVARNPVALGIQRVAEKTGYTVDYTKDGPTTQTNLRAYKTLQDIYRRIGEEGLERILTFTKAAWPHKSEATSEVMLRGLELLFTKYPHLDDERFIRLMGATTPMYIIGTARRLQDDLSSVIYSAVAQTLRGQYNKGMKSNRLPEWSD